MKHKINEELSKNDPIPELSRANSRLGIILFGPPAVGKSTFFKNYILPRCKNLKSFSSDDISFLITGDHNDRKSGSSLLTVKKLKNYIKTGQNYVYDTTGKDDSNILSICDISRKFKYKIIFIHVFSDLQSSIIANLGRSRRVSKTYLEFSHSVQFFKMIKYFNDISPENYYLIFRNNHNYQFYKYDGNSIFRKSIDGYLSI